MTSSGSPLRARREQPSRPKRLIVTADDFGIAVPVNEAVEAAHRAGILTSASLVVGGPATGDAVARARRLPNLRVGLHVVLVRGRPLLPASDVPALVAKDGAFRSRLGPAGLRFFFLPGARAQLEREIRSQFEAFRRSGLPLDHVDAHNHMHVHPTVLEILLRVGREYGVRAVRVPREPFLRSWRAADSALAGRLLASCGLAPWIALMRARLRRAGVRSNDWIFGRTDSGRMDEERVLGILRELPDGVSEIYFHPASRRWSSEDLHASGYWYERELAALTSPEVARAIQEADVQRIAFGDLSESSP